MSMKDVAKAAHAGDGSHCKPAKRPSMGGGPNGRTGSLAKVKAIANGRK